MATLALLRKVDLYAKCGALEKAQQVLEGKLHREGYCAWSLVDMYAKCGMLDKAPKIT